MREEKNWEGLELSDTCRDHMMTFENHEAMDCDDFPTTATSKVTHITLAHQPDSLLWAFSLHNSLCEDLSCSLGLNYLSPCFLSHRQSTYILSSEKLKTVGIFSVNYKIFSLKCHFCAPGPYFIMNFFFLVPLFPNLINSDDQLSSFSSLLIPCQIFM